VSRAIRRPAGAKQLDAGLCRDGVAPGAGTPAAARGDDCGGGGRGEQRRGAEAGAEADG
jgi:hypothetical protein